MKHVLLLQNLAFSFPLDSRILARMGGGKSGLDDKPATIVSTAVYEKASHMTKYHTILIHE